MDRRVLQEDVKSLSPKTNELEMTVTNLQNKKAADTLQNKVNVSPNFEDFQTAFHSIS